MLTLLRLRASLVHNRVPDLKFIPSRGLNTHLNYYDLLRISPKATLADIKKAYYEMSMVYHPDKSLGNVDKFRDITAAYEILSNNKLRTLYDKQLSERTNSDSASQSSSWNETHYGDKTRQQERVYENINVDGSGRKSKTYTGKTEQYDYDTWTKSHYSEMFNNKAFMKWRQAREKKETSDYQTLRRLDISIMAFLVFVMLGTQTYVTRTVYNNDIQRPLKPDGGIK